MGLKFDGSGLEHDGFSNSSMTMLAIAFTLSELEPVGIDGIKTVLAEAYARAGLSEAPVGPTNRVTLYGSTGRTSPAGSPQLEIRVRGGRADHTTYRFATGEYAEVLEQFP